MIGMRSRSTRRVVMGVGFVAIASLTLAGCAEGGTDDGDSGSVEGKTVKIAGGITGSEADNLQKSFDQFTEDTGIIVEYTGDKGFEGNIVTKVTGGDAPDIAIVPQPGLLKTLVETGDVIPAPEGVEANVDANWSPDWKAYGTFDDVFYAAPMLANIKGYVWYSPASFAEWGVEAPKTWDELLDLTATIQEKTGAAPWCAGFSSGSASGWPGTDWIEDLVLRQQGPDVYDDWVANKVKFTDPKIKEAFDSVGEILKNPEYVNASFGDVSSINSTEFGDVAPALASGACALHHQASFFSGFLEDAGATVAPDGDVWAFVTPGIKEGETAVTGGGEIVGAFSDDESTVKVQEYLSSPEWANKRVKLGGVISANNGLDPANASTPILSQAIEILQDKDTTFRFDASDLMLGAVGAGTFWKGLVNWINGDETDQVLKDIEAGWPSSE